MSYRDSFEYELHHTDIGKQLLDKYDILEEIYQSENSRIFKLATEKDGEILLLKVITKHSEFEFSIDRAIKLDHKGISKIFDYMESERFLYIIKEYVDGQDLETYVKEHGRLDESIVKGITIMLTDILDYLHNYNGSSIIFRDLKPSNIIVTEDGSIKLIDIVTLREINESKDTDTFYVGSRGYSAPEQFGYMQSKPTSDVYSLGATIYFLMTGEHPKVSMDFIELDRLSPKYARVVRRAMEFNPKDRYSTVRDMAQDLTSNKRLAKMISFVMGLTAIIIISAALLKTVDWSGTNGDSDDTTVGDTLLTDEPSEDELSEEVLVDEVADSADTTIDPNQFDPAIYGTEADVDLSELQELSQGYHFDYLDDRVLKVYLRREDMSEDLKDFKYIHVFPDGRPVGEFEAKREIYNLVNDQTGLDVYLPIGYEVNLSKADNALILLFADDYRPIGYLFYNDIPFEEEVSARIEILGSVEMGEGITVDYYRDFAKLHIDASLVPEFSKFSMSTVDVPVLKESVIEQHIAYAEGEKRAFSYYGDPFTFNWGGSGGFMDYDYLLLLQNDDYKVIGEYYISNIASSESSVQGDITSEQNESEQTGDESATETGAENVSNQPIVSGEIVVADGIRMTYKDNEAEFSFDMDILGTFDGCRISAISGSLKKQWALDTVYEHLEWEDAIWPYEGGTFRTSVPESTDVISNDWAIFLFSGTELMGEYFIYNLD